MQILLRCSNLVEALDIFTGRLGFRIEMIVPADSPRIAVVSGHGVTLRLEAETDATAAIPDDSHDLIVNQIGANDMWNEGRAEMLYRDLFPGRLGGLRSEASGSGFPVAIGGSSSSSTRLLPGCSSHCRKTSRATP
jgi:hypothetical protein